MKDNLIRPPRGFKRDLQIRIRFAESMLGLPLTKTGSLDLEEMTALSKKLGRKMEREFRDKGQVV